MNHIKNLFGPIAIFICAGCNVSVSDNVCSPRNENYYADYTYKSGDCSDKDLEIMDVAANYSMFRNKKSLSNISCSGDKRVSEDNCNIQSNLSCNSNDRVVKLSTEINWDDFGTNGNGTLSIQILKDDSSSVCSGVYKVRVEKTE